MQPLCFTRTDVSPPDIRHKLNYQIYTHQRETQSILICLMVLVTIFVGTLSFSGHFVVFVVYKHFGLPGHVCASVVRMPLAPLQTLHLYLFIVCWQS